MTTRSWRDNFDGAEQVPEAPADVPSGDSGSRADQSDLQRADATAEPAIAGPPATAGTAGIRRRLRSPLTQGLIALIVYLAGNTVFLTHAMLRHLGTPEIAAGSLDPNAYIWFLHWWPYALSHALNPLYSRQIGLPGGLNLAWATTMPAVSVALAPITAAFGPVAAFNSLLFVVAPLSAWTAFVATRRLTGKFWPALLAGAVYGFSSYTVNHVTTGQPNLSFNIWLPLIVYLIAVWRDGKLRQAGFVGLMAVVLALQFLTQMEVSVQITILGAAAVLLGLALAGRRHFATVLRLAVLLAIAYVASLVLVSPYLIYAIRHYPASLVRQPRLYSLNLSYLIVPKVTQTFGLTPLAQYAHRLAPAIGFNCYVGIPMLLVLAALVIFNARTRLVWLLAALFVLDLALAVGTILRVGVTWKARVPWGAIWSLPGLRSGEPARLILIGYLVLAIALAIWLSAPVRRRSIQVARWALGLLAVAAILADAIPARPSDHATSVLPPFIATGEYKHYIEPGEPIVVVSGRGNAGMLFQSVTDFYMRIGGGFINQSLTPRTDLPRAVANLARPDQKHVLLFLRYMRSAGITAIVVEADRDPAWTRIFSLLGLHGTRTGGVIFYPVPHCFSGGCTLPDRYRSRQHAT